MEPAPHVRRNLLTLGSAQEPLSQVLELMVRSWQVTTPSPLKPPGWYAHVLMKAG